MVASGWVQPCHGPGGGRWRPGVGGPHGAGCCELDGRVSSGWEWHAAQPVQRYPEPLGPRPTPGQVEANSAGRAGEAAGQSQIAHTQGLGRDQLLTKTDPAGPAGQVVGDDVQGEPGG